MKTTIPNDIKLFKKVVKAIINTNNDMTDQEKYERCASLIWNSTLPERLKDNCKEYIIDQLEEAKKWEE